MSINNKQYIKISLIHYSFWLLTYAFVMFDNHTSAPLTWIEWTSVGIDTLLSAIATHVYGIFLLKTKFFKSVKFKILTFFAIFIGLALTSQVISTLIQNIFANGEILNELHENIFNILDIVGSSINHNRFTLMCLSIYHLYFLSIERIKDKEEENKLTFELMTIQQESLKLKFDSDVLKKFFTNLEVIIPKDKDLSRKLVTAYSEILRNALSYDKTQLVPLETEIYFSKKYIFIANNQGNDPIEILLFDNVNTIKNEVLLPSGTLQTIIDYLLNKIEGNMYMDYENQQNQHVIKLFFEEKKGGNTTLHFEKDERMQLLNTIFKNIFDDSATVELVKGSKNYIQLQFKAR